MDRKQHLDPYRQPEGFSHLPLLLANLYPSISILPFAESDFNLSNK
jgi:hypothetical protein